MNLNDDFISAWEGISHIVYQNSDEHGFHAGYQNLFPIKIALIHSEISEALEAHRCGVSKDDKIPDFSGAEAELADAVIRIMDLAHIHNLRLGEAIIAKMKYNSGREFMHGGKSY